MITRAEPADESSTAFDSAADHPAQTTLAQAVEQLVRIDAELLQGGAVPVGVDHVRKRVADRVDVALATLRAEELEDAGSVKLHASCVPG